MRKRARERESGREWEIVRANPWGKKKKERKVRKDYIITLISLRKKKVLSRRLCIIALFSRLSERLSFLPRADYFCIEIFAPLSILLYSLILLFPFVLALLPLPRKIAIILRFCVEKLPPPPLLEAFLHTLLSSIRRACILRN